MCFLYDPVFLHALMIRVFAIFLPACMGTVFSIMLFDLFVGERPPMCY